MDPTRSPCPNINQVLCTFSMHRWVSVEREYWESLLPHAPPLVDFECCSRELSLGPSVLQLHVSPTFCSVCLLRVWSSRHTAWCLWCSPCIPARVLVQWPTDRQAPFILRDFGQFYCVKLSVITVLHMACWVTHMLCQSSKLRLLPDGLVFKQGFLLLVTRAAMTVLWLLGKGREIARLVRSFPGKCEDLI